MSAATTRCPSCGGLGRVRDDVCGRCNGAGVVPACAACGLEPVDPMFAPCCSGRCREVWDVDQKLAAAGSEPIVKRAP